MAETNNMPELEPCPFCGGHAVIITPDYDSQASWAVPYAECTECGAEHRADYWNTRTPTDRNAGIEEAARVADRNGAMATAEDIRALASTPPPADEREGEVADLRETLGNVRKMYLAAEKREQAALATIARLREAGDAAQTVIDYATSILWTGRPQAVAQRPAVIDQALRTIAKHKEATNAAD